MTAAPVNAPAPVLTEPARRWLRNRLHWEAVLERLRLHGISTTD